jgi:hypothetical protein
MTTTESTTDPHAEQWRQWQLRNAAISRTDALRARTLYIALFVALAGWFGWQLLAR